MGNFFDDIWGSLFGTDEETRTLPWSTEGPAVVQNYGQSMIDAYWQYIAESQLQNIQRMAMFQSGYENELATITDSEDALLQNLDALKSDLLAQRDTTYADIETMYGDQNTSIEEMADQARGTQEVADARRGLLGSTAHDSKIRGHDKAESEAKNELNQWRSSERNKANNTYTTGINSGQAQYDSGMQQLSARRQDAERALTTFQDQLYRENPVEMSMVPQLEYNMWNQLYATDWPGQQVVTQAATPGLLSGSLEALLGSAMSALGAEAGGAAWDALGSGWDSWWNSGLDMDISPFNPNTGDWQVNIDGSYYDNLGDILGNWTGTI
tara:strand:+ start:3053 stop:4030 length:978 start_codon:yes stop_codon:yes gene_type:complete